ncbi:MAG TPA: acyl-CoA dehydrogenase family protein [Ramlibacter sp.]|nr:acyl-CoA dehydrogenase family protein [Ramlibacter sp.]HVZ46518.1 acyl-CoA dehydrogenase family protein [Ramlibacter sp.]
MVELQYPKEVQDFMQRLREFARANLPDSIRRKTLADQRITREEQAQWQAKLIDAGFATPGWPVEYGGPGWSALEQHAYDVVMAEEGAPPAPAFGENMVASVLFAIGTPEQKNHYLPRIRKVEYYFCQGFSEPNAGSDLASLKTRAHLEGEEWVINGQKIWTSLAHMATHVVCLVRTDPQAARPQEGISMLIFPLDLPGITIRPIITIDEDHHTNEVFFDNVRVPKDALVGEMNRGWQNAKHLLGHERTSVARVGQSKRELKRLKALATTHLVDGKPLLRDPVFASKVAALECEMLAFEMTALRVAKRSQDVATGVEANLLKIKGSEIQQRLTELKLETLGPLGIQFAPPNGEEESASPLLTGEEGICAPTYFYYRVLSIYGGSNEIQRNIMAKSLGL